MEKLVPRLRFPGFEGNWERHMLGDIAKFSKGKGISKADIVEDGQFECIRYGELYTHYSETIDEIKSKTNIPSKDLVFSEANDVIIPGSGETQIDIATASCVMKSGIALGGDLNVIKSSINGVFLSYYLNNTKKMEIAVLAQGNAVVHLYASQLAKLKLNVPTEQEQDRIGTFIKSIAERIGSLQKKKALLEKYKKGMMQKIFNQEVRFKDEDGGDFGAWEEKTFAEVADIKRGASPRPINDTKWFAEDSRIGWVRISDVTKSNKFLTKTQQYLSDAGIKKSRLVKKGNLIMSICATIGKPIYTDFDVCIHDGFVVFENLKGEREFFFYYLEMIQKKWYDYGQPGTQVNLNSEIVNNEIIPFPSKAEQTKIANFLSAIDDKINLVAQEIEKMESWKKGLLGEMFV